VSAFDHELRQRDIVRPYRHIGDAVPRAIQRRADNLNPTRYGDPTSVSLAHTAGSASELQGEFAPRRRPRA
jgi:hypothetical protein